MIFCIRDRCGTVLDLTCIDQQCGGFRTAWGLTSNALECLNDCPACVADLFPRQPDVDAGL